MAVGAIVKSRSVNLTRIATVMDSDAKMDSRPWVYWRRMA